MFQAGKVGDAVDQIVGTGVFVFGDQICLFLWSLLNHKFVFSVFAICNFSVLGDQQEDSTTRRSRPVRTYRRTRYYARHKWFLLLLFILDGPTNCQCYQYQVPNQKPLFGLQKTLLLQQWLQKMLSNKLNKEKRFGWLIKEVKLK